MHSPPLWAFFSLSILLVLVFYLRAIRGKQRMIGPEVSILSVVHIPTKEYGRTTHVRYLFAEVSERVHSNLSVATISRSVKQACHPAAL